MSAIVIAMYQPREVEPALPPVQEPKIVEVNEPGDVLVEDNYIESHRIVFVFDGSDIRGSCKKDMNNMPACYSKSKRGIKKAWEALKAQVDGNTTMYGACEIITKAGTRMHTYCSMD